MKLFNQLNSVHKHDAICHYWMDNASTHTHIKDVENLVEDGHIDLDSVFKFSFTCKKELVIKRKKRKPHPLSYFAMTQLERINVRRKLSNKLGGTDLEMTAEIRNNVVNPDKFFAFIKENGVILYKNKPLYSLL